MKVVKLSRLEIGSGFSFVVVAGNSNRGVSIRIRKVDCSEVTALAGRIRGLAKTHRPFVPLGKPFVPLGKQECLCHLVESEIAIFLRLEIFTGLFSL